MILGTSFLLGLLASAQDLPEPPKQIKEAKGKGYLYVSGIPTSVDPATGEVKVYYFLYGLERAGKLYGTEKFGRNGWTASGAEYLLKNQEPTGAWNKSSVDTCFALLFLQRATRALVESVDNTHRRK